MADVDLNNSVEHVDKEQFGAEVLMVLAIAVQLR